MRLIPVLLLLANYISFSAQSAQEVTIAGWGGNDVVIVHNLLNDVLKEDLKKLNINVKYQAIESDFTAYIFNAISAGTAPDAFYADALVASAIVKSGKVLVNTDALQQIATQLQPNLNAAFTFNGTQYGLPKDFNTLALIFNKDLFDEAKVDYPNNNDNWQDFLSKLKTLKSRLGDEVTGMCITPAYERFAPFALATGWKPFDQNGKTILDDNFRRAFTFYTNLKKEGVAVLPSDLGQNWQGGCLGAENTAVAIEGHWISGYLRDKAPNLQYGSAKLPMDVATGKRGNLIFTVAWMVNKDSKQLAATEKTIELLTSEKAQNWVLNSGLALPSRKVFAESNWFKQHGAENQLAETVYQSVSDGYVMSYEFKDLGTAWSQPINEALNAVLLGQSDVEAALLGAQKKYNRMTAQ